MYMVLYYYHARMYAYVYGVVLSYCLVLSLHDLFRGYDREVPRVKTESGLFGVVHFGPSEIMTSFGISWNVLIPGYHDISCNPAYAIIPLCAHYGYYGERECAHSVSPNPCMCT
jgi:hypothetical protein